MYEAIPISCGVQARHLFVLCVVPYSGYCRGRVDRRTIKYTFSQVDYLAQI